MDEEPSYARFAAENQHLVPGLMQRDPRNWGVQAMQPNVRLPIYAAVRDALARHITPDERVRLDKLLDSFGLHRRD